MTLSPFENVTYQTTALSTGADSVMHLMRDDGMGYTQVAYNDNYGGGLGSRISFTNSSTTRDYLLVVRARSSVTHGSADLFRNGALVPDVIPIGGFIYDGSLVTQGANNTLHLVPQPNQIGTMPSSTWPVMFALNSSETTIVRTGLSGGAGGATAMSAAPTIDRLLIGTPTYYDGSQPAPVSYRDGWARALVNDFASDTDGDGLGDALENALGTCDGTITCPNAYTARDTDRDGLNDYDEVLGVIGPLGNGLDDISFPRWGASPLHKDVFVEVDYTYAPTSNFSIPADFPNPYARPLDVEQWVSDLRSAYDVGPNSHLHNPDGEDGVSVHVDIGVEPLDPKDEVFFGDYPSASVRPLVQNQTLTFSSSPSGIVYVRVDNQWRWFDATGLTNPELITEVWLAIYDTGRGVGASIDTEPVSGLCTPTVAVRAGLTYRYIRNDSGVPARVAGSAGHFQVVRSFGNAVVDLTEELTKNELPTTAGVLEMNRDWSDYLRNMWGVMAEGTGVSVYNDSEMGAVFGFALNNGTEQRKGGGLVFYPHMDGTPDLDLVVGSDFRIMEDYVCQDLAWAGGEPCGPVNVLD